MDICKNLNSIKYFEKSVLTIGSFDGMHCGHLEIIRDLQTIAKKKNHPSIVITFDPHPKFILQSHELTNWNVLTGTDKKLDFFEKHGVDYVWVIPFDMDFAQISAGDFLKRYIIKYFNPEDIIVGYDHHFGFEREGDSEFLYEQKSSYRYELHVKDPIKINNVPVSSTRIRNYLSQNNIKAANECLGWEYEVTGIVMKGSGIGREIKFPTANIIPEIDDQLIPAQGVYCVEVFVDGYSYTGMCNIGSRPTFHINGDKVIEVHIITEEELFLYDKSMKIKFKQFIRKEQKYDSAEDLANQLQLDRQECLSN